MLRCDLSAAARPRRGKQAEAKNRCRGCQMRTHVGEARKAGLATARQRPSRHRAG